MKCISALTVIGDDVAIAVLSDWTTLELAREYRDWKDTFKIRAWNRIVPVGTSPSGVMFTELTRVVYM